MVLHYLVEHFSMAPSVGIFIVVHLCEVWHWLALWSFVFPFFILFMFGNIYIYSNITLCLLSEISSKNYCFGETCGIHLSNQFLHFNPVLEISVGFFLPNFFSYLYCFLVCILKIIIWGWGLSVCPASEAKVVGKRKLRCKFWNHYFLIFMKLNFILFMTRLVSQSVSLEDVQFFCSLTTVFAF